MLLTLPTKFGWRAESTLEGFKPVTFRSPCEDTTNCATPDSENASVVKWGTYPAKFVYFKQLSKGHDMHLGTMYIVLGFVVYTLILIHPCIKL